ncbi:MAG TPA: transporter [bacterium]|nr:transporter [bacterium]
MPKFSWLFSFFLFLTVPAAWACSVCGCGDPLQSSASAHPLAGAVRLDFQSIYLTASAQSDDDVTQTEAVRQVNFNATLNYSPSGDWTLTAMLPLVEKYWTLSAGDAPAVPGGTLADSGTPFGIGDVMVGARYFFWQDTDFKTKEHQALALSGGAYLPTGGTDFKSGVTGDNLDTHSQLGTGAFGFYGGLLYNHVWDDFTLSANFNVVAHTKALTSDSTSAVWDYAFGTSYTGGISGQYHLADDLAISLAVEGRYADADSKANDSQTAVVTAPNTGGTVLDLSPGFSWNLSGDSVLYAKVQVPVYTNLIGVQTVDPTYALGTQFLLH